MATTLVLWDIDHTLIETRGVGGEIYADGALIYRNGAFV